MNMLILPSVIALGIKLWIFLVSRGTLFRDNKLLALFLCALFALNLVELAVLVSVDYRSWAEPAMYAYYASAIFSSAAFLALTVGIIWQKPAAITFIFSIAILLAALVWVPGFFIAGAESIGYSMIRIPGQYYWFLQLFLVAALFLGLCNLVYGAMKSKDNMVRKRSLVIFMSSAPMAISAIAIIGIMSMGYQFNATVILSFMTTITLAILIYTETRYRLFMFLSYVPYTRENQIRQKVAHLVRESIESLFKVDGGLDMKAMSDKFDRALIEMAIEATDGNKTHAAEVLQIGKATLHRKLVKA